MATSSQRPIIRADMIVVQELEGSRRIVLPTVAMRLSPAQADPFTPDRFLRVIECMYVCTR